MKIGKWIGLYLGLFALLLRFFATSSPSLTEKWYTASLYPLIRVLLDHTVVLLPFPAVYLLLITLIYIGYRFIRTLTRIESRKQKLLMLPRLIINCLGIVVFAFLMFWGYNYYRIPLYQQLEISPSPLSTALLIGEMGATQNTLVSLRKNSRWDSSGLAKVPKFSLQNALIREEMKSILKTWNLSWKGRPVVKQLYPEGTLRKLGIFGIYFPFTGEAYLDPSLHPLEKGFTMAHEMAHGFGITDEGEANFIAWLVCSQSSQSFYRYAAALKLFRYQLNDLYRMDKEAYSQFLLQIPEPIKNDIREVQANNRAIMPIASELSRKTNDFYLKSQGVKAGVLSYAQLPMLVHSWRHKE